MLYSDEPGIYTSPDEPSYRNFDRSSFYISMRDSVNIAVDLYLPRGLEEDKKIPLIMQLTRYTRSLRLKWPWRWFVPYYISPGLKEEIEFFIRHGYAYMIIDARGSGASFGNRPIEFSPEEIRDAYDIAEWVIRQPWSNKRIGATGISYPGTTAELMLIHQHPAIKAVFCRNSIFDLYDDITFPGGLRHSPFVKVWGDFTRKIDLNDFSPFGRRAVRFVESVSRVDNDRRGQLLTEAIAAHNANTDIFSELVNMKFRDDRPSFDSTLYLDLSSVHYYTGEIEKSGAAIYRLTGYFDGALANSSVKGFLSMQNPQKMILGPWRHGSERNKSPHRESLEMPFDANQEMLRFFDYHLKGIDNGIMDEPPIYYYTMSEEKWKWASEWPPKHTYYQPFYFSKNKLSQEKPTFGHAIIKYDIDYSTTTGLGSRWNSLTELYMYEPTGYPNRALESKKLLNIDSDPLTENVTVTGHVIAEIFLASSSTDGNVLVYLEEVEENGTVHYVTEGQLRLIHRKEQAPDQFSFKKIGPYRTFKAADAMPMDAGKPELIRIDLQPVSYRFSKGNRIRISIAGADVDHFDHPEDKPAYFQIYKGNSLLSKVLLPIEKK